jgi:penicillin-binding protein 1A
MKRIFSETGVCSLAMLYWSMVLGVWGLIFVVAFFAVFASDLPDTSKLYDVKRQPSINYLDRSGALLAVRGSQYAPPVDLDALPNTCPAAFVAIEDRQFYHHFGFNPWGIVRSLYWNLNPERPPARRLDHHPAAGPQPVPQPCPELSPQGPGTDPGRLAGAEVLQEADPGALPEPGLFRGRRLWHRGRLAALFQQARRPADDRRGRPAGRPDEGPGALFPGLGHRPRRPPRHGRAGRDGAQAGHHRRRARRGLRHPVRVSATLANQRAQYFTDWVDAQVRSLVGEPTEDLVVETTLDLPIQAAAERSVQLGVRANKAVGVEQAALVAIDGEGRVRAYVGGPTMREPVRPRHRWPAARRARLSSRSST